MIYPKFLAAIAISLAFSTSQAAPITYSAVIDTSSISGTTGAVDFQFNPGLSDTQLASLQIMNYASNGTLGTPLQTGAVSGALPGNISFENSTIYNDFFTTFSFGSFIAFDIQFDGPAVNTPDGISSSESVFAFSMFSDSLGTVPVLTTDVNEGLAFLINLNLDGTTSLVNNSPQSDVRLESSSSVPEPSTLILLITALLYIAFVKRTVLNRWL